MGIRIFAFTFYLLATSASALTFEEIRGTFAGRGSGCAFHFSNQGAAVEVFQVNEQGDRELLGIVERRNVRVRDAMIVSGTVTLSMESVDLRFQFKESGPISGYIERVTVDNEWGYRRTLCKNLVPKH